MAAPSNDAVPARTRRLRDPAAALFALVLALTLANLLFNLAAPALGAGFPYTSFLGPGDDRFADFFKVVFSYPGGKALAASHWGWLDAHLRAHMTSGYDPRSPLLTADRFTTSDITHFHLTPLSTLLSLTMVQAMRWIDPGLLFGGLCALLAAYLARICLLVGGWRAGPIWLVAALVSYPLLMVWDRGNLFAGLTALMLVHALLLALRGRAPALAAVLLAIAVNIRPNAAIFALPVLWFLWPQRARLVIVGAAATVAIGAGALLAAHALYPAYDIASFLAGLRRYYLLYVVDHGGLAYGSSLLGAFKLLVGYRPGLETVSAVLAGAILPVAAVLRARHRLGRSEFVFLICASYALGSAVFADYHLLIFLIVPMAAAIDGGGRIAQPAWLCSALMLAPKNYLFADGVSAQVLINPLLLLAGVGMVIMRALSATIAPAPSTTKGGPSPDRPSLAEAGSRLAPGDFG